MYCIFILSHILKIITYSLFFQGKRAKSNQEKGRDSHDEVLIVVVVVVVVAVAYNC
jgi:hypothetical protein